jgi:hypothetical protein
MNSPGFAFCDISMNEFISGRLRFWLSSCCSRGRTCDGFKFSSFIIFYFLFACMLSLRILNIKIYYLFLGGLSLLRCKFLGLGFLRAAAVYDTWARGLNVGSTRGSLLRCFSVQSSLLFACILNGSIYACRKMLFETELIEWIWRVRQDCLLFHIYFTCRCIM